MFFKNLLRRMFREAALPRRNGLRFRPAVESIEERITPANLDITVLGDISEGGSAASFRFTRSDNTDTFSVGLNTTGTASGLDYSYMPMVTFTAGGSLTADLSITPSNDSNVEGTETIIVTIVPNPPYYSSNGSATMNLFDDDTPQVTVAKIGSDPTEGGTGTFRISRTGPTTSSLGVTFTIGGTATEGTDFDTIGTSVSIPANSASVDVTVTSRADNSVEGGETVTISITDGGSSYTANNATASLTIADDPPVISISATNAVENASGAFTFTRTGGKTADAITVNYTVTGGTATSGTDFTALSGSVSIAAGKSSADVTLSALPDNLVEGDETVTVTIGSGSYTIGTSAATATITDDPPVVSVSRLNDGTEGGSNGAFRVSRTGGDTSAALVVTYTVAGTANPASNTDYTAFSGTVTIAASASYADITVTVTNDGSVESAETVILTLDTDTDWVNGSASGTLFIWDNDGTYIEWEGDENDNWMDPDNWTGGVVPGSSDTVVFTGTTTYDPILSGPLSPVTLAGLVLEAGFTGIITLEFPIEVGSLQMAGGTLDQPYSAYGSDITITGVAIVTGGVLNSTSNLASITLAGTTVIDVGASNTLEIGSDMVFVGAAVAPASTTVRPGTLQFNNTASAVIGEYATLLPLGQASTGQSGNVEFLGTTGITINSGGTFSITGPGIFSTNLWLLNNGGTLKLSGSVIATISGERPTGVGTDTASVVQSSGTLSIESNSSLTATHSFYLSGGTIVTQCNPTNPMGLITATLVGDMTNTGADIIIHQNNFVLVHPVGYLKVIGNVSWTGGKFKPVVSGSAAEVSDRWVVTGTLSVGGTAGIDPITHVPPGGVPSGRTWTILQTAGITGNAPTPTGTTSYSIVSVGNPVHSWKLNSD